MNNQNQNRNSSQVGDRSLDEQQTRQASQGRDMNERSQVQGRSTGDQGKTDTGWSAQGSSASRNDQSSSR